MQRSITPFIFLVYIHSISQVLFDCFNISLIGSVEN